MHRLAGAWGWAGGGEKAALRAVGGSPASPIPPELAICPGPWQAPCRMHLAAVMLELKAPLYRSGEDIFIPNCDTKGFYRKKQVR